MSKKIIKMFIFLHLSFVICSALGGSFAQEVPRFYGEEVVVTATRFPQLKSELPVSSTVITRKDIDTFGAKNLGDVLKYTFGTYSRTTGFLGSQISGGIHGSSYQQMLVMINGQRINSPLLGGYDLGDILVDNIEKVEIVRGPASALYGADALGGVVNIVTRKEENAVEIYPLISERGINSTRIFTAGKQGNTNYVFSVSQNTSPGYRTNSDYSALNYSGELSWNLSEKLKMTTGFDIYNAKKGVPGSLTFPTSNTRQEDSNQRLRVLSEAKLSDWSEAQLNFSYNQMEQLYNTSPTTTPYDKYKSYTYLIEAQNKLHLNRNNLLIYGVEYQNDRSDSTLAGGRIVTNKAFFLQDQHDFSDRLILLLGSRFDKHSIYGDSNSPRIGLVYKLGKENSFRASYGEAYRAPTLNDLYTYYVDPTWGMIMRGSTNLKPEKSRSSEIGFTYKLRENAELTANYFSSKVENLIEWVDISGIWMTYEAQNVASADLSGYELGLTYYFLTNLKGTINYTSLKAADASSGKDLTYRPRVQYNLGLQYNDNFGIFVRHVGERYDNKDNTRKVDAYTVADIKFDRRLTPKLILTLGAENFLNTSYQDTYDYPMPGRRFTFGMKYSLI